MRYVIRFSIILTIIFTNAMAQDQLDYYEDEWKRFIPSTEFNLIPKRSGHYSIEDWQVIIDSTWGPGLPTATKLQLFTSAWNTLDAQFAAFQNLTVDWDEIYNVYHSEISTGVSAGRFAAIMNHMAMALQDCHTRIRNSTVNYTPISPGIPLHYFGSTWANTSRFGASLTALQDSTALVIKTIPNHPLGLVPGDIILGYDGIPWKDLYKDLLTAQLPMSYSIGGYASDPNSLTHIFLSDVGMNWHLFDTLDVLKYNTGDTLHFPTSSLAGQNTFIWGNEQLPVPGVPWVYEGTANIMWPFDFGDAVTWGIVDGTNIGYIYVIAWTNETQAPGLHVAQQFYDAVDSLMNVHHANGLIIDLRLNYGGIFEFNDGFSLLYNNTFKLIDFSRRGNPSNHFYMIPHHTFDPYLTIEGDPNTLYDRPIAVLTGPSSVSAGDISILTINSHPMSRLFGKQSNGAFSSATSQDIAGNSDWRVHYAKSNIYLLSNPGNYLTHIGFPPDEEVWFTPDDVANGEDTVVKAALAWINSMIHAFDVKPHSRYVQPLTDSLNITAKVKNPPNHNLQVAAIINTHDSVFVDSLPMYDDGNHGDSLAGDGIYGCYSGTFTEGNVFSIDASVTDLDSSHYHKLTNANRFTTGGPVVMDHHEIPNMYPSLNLFHLKLYLRNDGSLSPVTNVSTEISTTDTNVTAISTINQNYGNIDPGQVNGQLGVYHIYTQNNPRVIDFTVNISSEGWAFWSDSIRVVLDSSSAIIHVPADQPTIQAGVDAAIDGDTVLVQPGIYNEFVNFNGKNIVVGSLTLLAGDTSYISQTVISGRSSWPIQRFVTFENGEDSTAMLCGFTINRPDSILYGGGLTIVNASPTVTHMTISNSFNRDGGGIGCENSNARFLHIKVLSNNTYGGLGGEPGLGGGIYCINSDLTLEDVNIRHNVSNLGGGVYCENSNLKMANAIVDSNIVFEYGPMGEIYPGIGGGIYIFDCTESILDSVIIKDNSAQGHGGGILCESDTIQTNINLMNVTIKNNIAQSGGGISIGLWHDSTDINLLFDNTNRCNIYNNTASQFGNDLYTICDSVFLVVVDTFTVLNPDSTHAYPLNKFTFDILNPAPITDLSEVSTNIPIKYALYQNYPNPFNPSTTIEFDLPKTSKVTLKIFNILGQEVETLVSDRLSAGSYSYKWNASNLASGVYLYRLETEGYVEIKKMILIR